jgi:hypothetical protein
MRKNDEPMLSVETVETLRSGRNHSFSEEGLIHLSNLERSLSIESAIARIADDQGASGLDENKGMLPTQKPHSLDHFVWKSLTTYHRHLAIGDDLALRYPAEVGPFAALRDYSLQDWSALSRLVPDGDHVTLVTLHRTETPPQFTATRSTLLNQLVLSENPGSMVADARRLGASDVPDMLELVSLTRPGPFGKRT